MIETNGFPRSNDGSSIEDDLFPKSNDGSSIEDDLPKRAETPRGEVDQVGHLG